MKQLHQPRQPTTFFGQSTERDLPYLVLAQAMGVWGSPPEAPAKAPKAAIAAPLDDDIRAAVQGDLFGSWMGSIQ